VMIPLFGPPAIDEPPPSSGKGPPKLDWAQALAQGQALMQEQGALHGFKAGEPQSLVYLGETRQYWYRAHTDRFFPDDKLASITFDADNGAFRSSGGTNSGGAYMTVTNWLMALHMVTDPVDYLAYRIFVAVVGFVIAMLSVTGVYVWWKKRKARISAHSRSASTAARLAQQT